MSSQSGQTFVLEGTYPKGHIRNPASPAELAAKFDSLATELLSPQRRDQIRATVAGLEHYEDASVLVDSVIWATV